MLEIKKQYIVDESNRKIAVQIRIETFQKIEQVLEDYALAQMMMKVEGEPALDLERAKCEYQKLLERS
ncbi:hypothetical protein HYR99_17475 [Candidatus Poribacteria bacterium]|nr:hypothetical protein [Candidatus Poribacteria bacterium]